MELLPENTPEIVRLIVAWGITNGLRIVLILIGMLVAMKVAKIIGNNIVRYASKKKGPEAKEDERRIHTLVQIFNVASKVLIIVFGGMIIIKELGIDIGPMLAGAGILGLAVGFGSQALVKDLVTGFFLILENQIRVGDVVRIGDYSGLVEQITLRTVILRDLEGIVHTIPNGEIATLSNMTYGWSRVKFDIGVAYKENIDEVMKVLEDLGRKIHTDEKYKDIILEEPTILGVDSLDDSCVTIRMIIKTEPLKQWDVAREFRRRVKNEFDRLGIEIPFPHQTIYIRQDEELTFGMKQGKTGE
ncbi:MAG: mechanosensitive ion channel family protein [candidate division Zixibacteria bacterium]